MPPRSLSLQPLRDKPEYWEAIERVLRSHLRSQIYDPIVSSLAPRATLELVNSYEDLVAAIQKGRIQYVDGHFEGRLDSKISSALKGLGARWERSQGWWSLPSSKLTPDIRMAIESSFSRFREMNHRVNTRLQELDPQTIADGIDLDNVVGAALYKVDRDFKASTEVLGVRAEMTPARRESIAESYTQNMRRYIKDWSEKEIVRLRERVQKNAFEGFRYEGLVHTIQSSYGTSQKKAQFLARQETNLLLSSFRKTRYLDAGLPKYRWKCAAGSGAHPVRPMHKMLDGTIQRWDQPPVTSPKGDRNHPGEDFGCRCIAIPIVEFR